MDDGSLRLSYLCPPLSEGESPGLVVLQLLSTDQLELLSDFRDLGVSDPRERDNASCPVPPPVLEILATLDRHTIG